MGYMDAIRKIVNFVKSLIRTTSFTALQPKEIIDKIFLEIEKRKKLGIEESAYVPNVYAIYLSPADQEELSPFLSGIKEQLIKKIVERVRKKGYKLLSSSVSLEIRKDSALERNQLVVESSFLKEKSIPSPAFSSPETETHLSSKEASQTLSEAPQKNVLTKVIEEKRTKMIDNTRVKLEILEGEGKGDLIALKEGDYTFGRGREARMLLKDSDDTVSRVHFKLTVNENRIGIKDLSSTNGTKVNGIEIEEAELKKGDTINAGKVLLRVA
jgi:hypothetical protein